MMKITRIAAVIVFLAASAGLFAQDRGLIAAARVVGGPDPKILERSIRRVDGRLAAGTSR